jgi:hypothetical protein
MMRLVLLGLLSVAAGCSGQSTPSDSPPTITEEKAVTEPATGSVKGLLAKVEALPDGTKSFELFVPQDLTMQGRPVAQNMAMALVLDRLLGRGLFPDGFEQRPTGRRYKYK